MTRDKKNRKINLFHVESISRRSASRMKITDELAGVCEPEKLRAEMKLALTKNEDVDRKMSKLQKAFSTAPIGKVYAYKEKGDIKAVCIFTLEERELPISAAVVKESEISSKKTIDGRKLKEFFDIKDAESVRVNQSTLNDETVYELRKCYVKKALYIVPSYEEHREALVNLFRRQIEEIRWMTDIDAYIWDDELVMTNMVKEGGTYENALSIGVAIGISLGACIGMMMDNMALGMLFGVAIGTGIAGGTTTIINFKK